MKITATAGLLALGVALAMPVYAQEATQPADNAAPADAAPATKAPATTQAAPEAATVAAGAKVLPNGQDITPDHMENGRWYNAEGIPTFKIDETGAIDFATFSGFRRYSAECHVCHGPDGEGSTYAPALKNSVLKLDYYQYQQIVASGKQDINTSNNLVMPAFGTNKNVWCYADDIYTYLLARGTNELPRGRPAKRADKTPEFTAQEDSCMNG